MSGQVSTAAFEAKTMKLEASVARLRDSLESATAAALCNSASAQLNLHLPGCIMMSLLYCSQQDLELVACRNWSRKNQAQREEQEKVSHQELATRHFETALQRQIQRTGAMNEGPRPARRTVECNQERGAVSGKCVAALVG